VRAMLYTLEKACGSMQVGTGALLTLPMSISWRRRISRITEAIDEFALSDKS
jgi:hypothetical protein